MKFSTTFILLAFLPKVICKKKYYDVRTLSTQPLSPELKIAVDSQMEEVKKVVGPEIQAISDEVTRALAGQDGIDTKMVNVEEVIAPELLKPTDPDHRALRGQNRELPSCTQLCIGLQFCWVSFLSGLRQQLCKRVLTFDSHPSHFVAFNRTAMVSLVSPCERACGPV